MRDKACANKWCCSSQYFKALCQGHKTNLTGQYPADFDLVIDECHRGGAKDESRWRGIMEYFSSAQIGLTATPKFNADTYNYFGEPVYTYSLKDGLKMVS